jgi:hypothetical protein
MSQAATQHGTTGKMGEDKDEWRDTGGDEEDDSDVTFQWEATGRESPLAGEREDDESEAPAYTESNTSDRVWHQFGFDGAPAAEHQAEEIPDEKPPSEDEAADDDDGGTGRMWEMGDDGMTPGEEAGVQSSTPAAQGVSGKVPTEGRDGDTQAADNAPTSRFDSLIEDTEGRESEADRSPKRSEGTELETLFSDLDQFDRATSGSQVLVVSPRDHRITKEICSHNLTSGSQSSRNILFVTTVQNPEERVSICRESEEWTGGNVGVIEVGDVMEGSASEGEVGPVDGSPVTYKRVKNVKNLSKLGLLTTQIINDWADSSQPSGVCFHTLSTLAGYVQKETLHRFLFTLQARLSSLGVSAHYHLDAGAHDPEELATYESIFDLVLQVDQDGRIELD